MSEQNTVPHVLYKIPDPLSQPSELYAINATVLESATDPAKRWVIKELHGYWDEAEGKFKNPATTLLPNEPHLCMSIDDIQSAIMQQVMLRVRQGFKYQMLWSPYPPFYRRFEIQPDGTKREY